MTAADRAETSGFRPELVSTTYRRLQRMGFEDSQAANLAAFKNGVAVCTQPWTVREIAHLLFLRALRRAGRRWSDADDRAALIGGARRPAFPRPRPLPLLGNQHSDRLPGPSVTAPDLRTIRKEVDLPH